MSESKRVAILVGSLRAASLHRKLAAALAELAPDTLSFEFVEVGDLPHYNPDLEGEVASWDRFRETLGGMDAVLFVTPEYNRSVPGVLKNALDVGSRPWGQSIWQGKPAAVVTGSPGGLGGFGASHHLRQSLACLGVPVVPSPEVYLGGLGQLLGEDGSIDNEQTRTFLAGAMASFAAWVQRLG